MVFLSINQMPRNASVSSKTTDLGWFRRIQFLEMHHIINSCTTMSKIYGNKDAKSCTTWSFPWYREEEIHRETCWHVWQICRVINSLNADTATRLGFTKIVPRKFHLWFRSSQLLIIYPLGWIMDCHFQHFSQGKPTTAWCRRSMHRKSNDRTNTQKHSTPPITPSPRCTET